MNPFNSSVFKVLTVGLPWQLSLLLLVWGGGAGSTLGGGS